MFVVVVGTTLSGCVGSYFTEGGDAETAFPDLHDVPERPELPDREEVTKAQQQLEQATDAAMEENKRLREKFGKR